MNIFSQIKKIPMYFSRNYVLIKDLSSEDRMKLSGHNSTEEQKTDLHEYISFVFIWWFGAGSKLCLL